MKSEQSIYTPVQRKKVIFVILVLLGGGLLLTALPIIGSLLSAAILYILFKPLFLYLINKKRLNKSLSAGIVITISFLVIVLPLSLLSFLIVDKLIAFQNAGLFKDSVDKFQHIAGLQVNLKEMLMKSINDISKWVMGAFSVFVNSAVRIFISLIIVYFTLFFLFKSHVTFENALLKYLPFDKTNSYRFAVELKKITYSNILGQGLIGISQGLVVAIGFLIFGIPDPLFWGVVSIFVCFLPIVGAPIIFVPAGLIELMDGNTTSGIGILIWGTVLVTLVDNFLRQFISKKIADTHPLITIIGVIIGIPVFGLIGLVIGPFMISFFILLFKMYEINYLRPVEETAQIASEIEKVKK
jgi:predicted PurR-regulated permease PerM